MRLACNVLFELSAPLLQLINAVWWPNWKLLLAAFDELSPLLFGEPLLSLFVNLFLLISTEPELLAPTVATFSLSLNGGCFFV